MIRKAFITMLISLIGLQARSENFSCRVHDAEITGTDSTLVCRLDGEEIEMDIPDGMRLKGLDAFGEGLVAITEGRHILYWDSPLDKARKVLIEMKGNFTGIDAGEDVCHAVSDSSEIISINLALMGKVFDFNSQYAGYYGKIRLIDIAAGTSSICVAAERADGRPAAFVSSKGNVWRERILNHAVDGTWHMFEKVPHRITYEELSDHFVLHCEDGTEFHLPACSHCNYVVEPVTLR